MQVDRVSRVLREHEPCIVVHNVAGPPRYQVLATGLRRECDIICPAWAHLFETSLRTEVAHSTGTPMMIGPRKQSSASLCLSKSSDELANRPTFPIRTWFPVQQLPCQPRLLGNATSPLLGVWRSALRTSCLTPNLLFTRRVGES